VPMSQGGEGGKMVRMTEISLWKGKKDRDFLENLRSSVRTERKKEASVAGGEEIMVRRKT